MILKSPEDFYNILIATEEDLQEDAASIITPYVYSLVTNYNPALNAIAEKAADYLYQNIANDQLRAIYEQINNYLQKRLKNSEC